MSFFGPTLCSSACDPVSFVLGNQKVARFIFSLYMRSAGAINSLKTV